MSSASVVQTPIIVRTVAELRRQVKIWKQGGERIAFVPTMGNLHAGHLSLMASVNQPGIRRVVSIFVNPMQFGDNEDFGEYPRTFDEDVRKLAEENIDMVFAPNVAEIYPQGTGHATAVEVPGLSGILEGEVRPGFFRGVAT
ncbi:MAG: pantoate--beta-alanine ligase, partial [Gammaproteobacteria bacterium]|nr:pantoate--beta-alanine ligase [Gammaproteobacteria bacterium]